MKQLTVVHQQPSTLGAEAEQLVPLGASCAVLAWPMAAEDSDAHEAIAQAAVDALHAALLRTGALAFRWDDSSPPPKGKDTRYFPEPRQAGPPPGAPQSWLTHLRDVLRLSTRPLVGMTFSVLTTSDPVTARLLFAHEGWSLAEQAVIAYDPSTSDLMPIVQVLQHGLDWRRYRLPPGARLLLGLGHDGAFGVVAAAAPEILKAFLDDLEVET